MGRRGRPPYPDILTPREWEVLALLRENLTNEAIADRLGVTHAAAKYHVSQILSKLGVATREEAAAWQPEAPREPRLRRWWAGLAGWLRPVTLGKAALIGAAVAVLAGLGLLGWTVWVSGEGDRESAIAVTATSTPTATPFPETPTPTAAASVTPVMTPVPRLPVRDAAYGSFGWRTSLYAFDPDTQRFDIIFDIIVERIPYAYDWSANGDRFAYVESYDDLNVKITDRAGGRQSITVSDFDVVRSISWSPDGERVLINGEASP